MDVHESESENAGLSLSFEETVQAAVDFGFEGVELDQATLVDTPPGRLKQRIDGAGLHPGGWGVPFDVTADESSYRAGLGELGGVAARAGRWAPLDAFAGYGLIRDLGWDENWRFHVGRLQPVATTLAEHGCRLGLEFVGPATSRQGHRHPFVHTVDEALALCREVGQGTGLLLDSWHWYASVERRATSLDWRTTTSSWSMSTTRPPDAR